MNFSQCSAEPKTLYVDRDEFVETRRVRPLRDAEQNQDALEHISCGEPFSGHRVEIRGDAGELLPQGHEGEIFVVGPSIAHAYFNNPAASAELIEHNALRTGDLGYLYEGELYVTGRLRELIVVNGKNIHPHSIEWPVMELKGVCRAVALCRSGRETEEIVLVVETKRTDQAALRELIFTRCFDACGVTPRVIMFVKPGTVPRTTSGKLRRTSLLNTLKAQEDRLEMEDAAQ
jgi:fatty-acyl-CoA synthase